MPSIEVAYVWHAGVHGAEVARGIERLGLEIRSQIIWVKEHLVISRGDNHCQHEPCWYAVRAGRTARWIGKRDLATTWTLASPKVIMWADSGPEGRRAIATALFARIEVEGYRRMEYELTPEAIELGLSRPLPAILEVDCQIGEFGRGERI